MVKIEIFVEGNAAENTRMPQLLVTNGSGLRQGFSVLLRQKVSEDDFDLKISMQDSITKAVPNFKKNVGKIPNLLLLIDLDASESERTKRLKDNDLEDFSDRVFFMIQEMEAWFLSQPQAIEKAFLSNLKKPNIAADSILRKQHASAIKKPSDVLSTIFKRHFEITENGKPKKRPYKKSSDAQRILQQLNLAQLSNDFGDVARLLEKIQTYQ
jgi:Domain of unknown function (DUF4276)